VRWVRDLYRRSYGTEETPDFRIGFFVGILGGLVGALVMRGYERKIAPQIFPGVSDQPENAEITPPIVKLYRDGETASAAWGRILFTMLMNHEPVFGQTQNQLQEWVYLAYGMTMGAFYGGTRTTTRWRDLASGFFYGLRLWLGETLGLSLLGLRADPRSFSLRQHGWHLSRQWVYSFTTTAVTRILYRLVTTKK